ncbi:sodium:solute symporter [Campylobacter geochelonis]|uniref:Na+/panthothenate symporter n=1 Tax=Campylobacter geochelonis TaxID=1780362 RepID=A0A128EE43_9BACT|nr:sodium:solute symporter [Campylobacter geochelonis]QKF70606.1 sodium:solute symporter [Campylobacter geochelonis]CZE45943.1 Na+/panthothenate symporter [Campylobacter geochelonis]CZE46692.1 Na+/panthothenate symporter [Campylobacter geochelonis]CZE50351.1 Na+/panthothenate symporter [Campylobacter geochelonis]
MQNSPLFTALFWGFLLSYGLIMWLISPKITNVSSFFEGRDEKGNSVSSWLLITSIFISWIFAKSVTNAANLGAVYGIVGGVAYAIYWLCIPVAGFALYRLRVKYGAKSLIGFLNSNYGKWASIAFSVAIAIRLYNEIWSNTSVVGGYYGQPGSASFITAAFVFTIATLLYSLKGGLRGSIITDVAQALVFVIGIVWALGFVLPKHSLTQILSTGTWSLGGGVDLLLVSCLQILSYPFHDPVLTDRGFLCREKVMLKSFIVAGVLGFLAILVFSFIGVYANLEGIISNGNIPAQLASTMGVGAFFLMNIIMITAAGSTLDSTFASVSKLVAYDFIKIFTPNLLKNALKFGMLSMIFIAVFGNLPMVMGTDILKATTISGTMVMGLAPVFLLHGFVKPTSLSFHLSFWAGIAFGFIDMMGLAPEILSIGDGKYAKLLGINLYGLIVCSLLYIAGSKLQKGKI